MCGIAAYIGDGNAFDFISQALIKMEYRGYDSYGIRVGQQEHKELGAPSDSMPDHMDGTIGIGHTRWATHGTVNTKNCHPVSHMGVHVVHNGTVENEQQHRERQGTDYQTDTDTEIIAVELFRNLDMSLDKLDDIGSFVAMVDGVDGLYVYRGSNPLYYQDGKIASDLRAFEGDVHVIPEDTFTFIKRNFKAEKNWKVVYAKREEEENVKCYMKHEIISQAEIIKELKLTNVRLPARRIKFVACGSSYYAAMTAAWFINTRMKGYDITAEYATEFIYTGHEDAIVFISQSGETKDVIDALKSVVYDSKSYRSHLHEDGYGRLPIFILQNKKESTLSQIHSDAKVINMNAGLEIGVAATKTFCATICQLVAMGGHLFDLEGIANSLNKASEELEKSTAFILEGYNNVLILGSGSYYPLALEAALKLKEVAYIHAEAMPADEVKHGPIALIDKDTLSIVIGNTSNRIENNVKQIESRGGSVVRMSGSWWTTLCKLQWLSYNLAILRGLDPDKPRNLAKTVTV